MITPVKEDFVTVAHPHPTRDVLIDAALELFARDGYRGTTIRKIEEAAGLTPGAGGMYRHFRSKEELLLAAMKLYQADVAEFIERSVELLDLGDVRAELLLAAKLSREFNERNDALLRVLLLESAAVPAKARRQFETAWNEGYRSYAQWLERKLGTDSGVDIEAAAIQLFGSLAQYQIQERTFFKPPLGVDYRRFVAAWVDHWAEFIATASSSRRRH
jgi:AcrR family transcriptional regulator